MSTPNGIVVWDLAPDALLAAACDVAGRNLPEQEWRDHIDSLAPRTRLCPTSRRVTAAGAAIARAASPSGRHRAVRAIAREWAT